MRSLENILQEQFETIERYLHGDMTVSETEQFEAELKVNDTLKQQLEAIRNLVAGVETAVLKEKLDVFHAELSPAHKIEPVDGRSFGILKWSVAAVVVATLGIFWMLNTGNSNKQLFATHFTPDPGLPTTMGTTDNYEFYDGMVNYKQGEYNTAIKKWKPLLASNQKNDTLQYFIGVAFLADGNENDAIQYLQTLWENRQHSFKNETAYYLGLAYLKADKVEDAIKYLTFSEAEGAKQLLSEIKN